MSVKVQTTSQRVNLNLSRLRSNRMTSRNFGEMSGGLAEEVTNERNVYTKKKVVNSSFQFFNNS